MPGMAAQEASQCEPRPTRRPMYLDRLARVRRAGRVEAALAAEERAQQQAIAVDQSEQDRFHAVIEYRPALERSGGRLVGS
jgi:hypothetical protein